MAEAQQEKRATRRFALRLPVAVTYADNGTQEKSAQTRDVSARGISFFVDAPIAADHTHSIVVDIPFGIRGGLPLGGRPFPPESMVLATADGHPLANAYVSRIPSATLAGIVHRPFYAALMRAESDLRPDAPAQLRAARRSASSARREYSTRAGTSAAKIRRATKPSHSSERRVSVMTFFEVPGRQASSPPWR